MLSTSLTRSCSNSYQSSSTNTIECPICLEKISNNFSLMGKCKHSWCFSCNEQLNNKNIRNCPICKLEFEPLIKNGKLIYRNKRFMWKRGILDSDRKIWWKERKVFVYNMLQDIEPNLSFINLGFIHNI